MEDKIMAYKKYPLNYRNIQLLHKIATQNSKDFDGVKSVSSNSKPVQSGPRTAPTNDNETPTTQKKPFDLGGYLKGHWDSFSKDPWAWATDNPWVAAGGIGALTGLLAGNRGNNNNNNQGGYNILNGILPGLLVTGLAYGAFKGIPWLMKQINKAIENHGQNVGRGAVDRVVNKASDTINDITQPLKEVGEWNGKAGMREVIDNMKKRTGAPIVPAAPKTVDQKGRTRYQGVDSQGNKLVHKEEDVAQGWIPVKDANGNIVRYEETNKSLWDRFMDLKRGLYD